MPEVWIIPSRDQMSFREVPWYRLGLAATLLCAASACAPGAGTRSIAPPPTPGEDARPKAERETPAGQHADARATGRVGVLVMAHGGTEDWNAAVLEAIPPIGKGVPVVVSFGMAEPTSLQLALDSLAFLGVDRVAVVRLFVSGSSFLEQTAYLLGLSEEKPPFFMVHGRPMAVTARGPGKGHEPAAPGPLAHDMIIATHGSGLMGSPEVSEILLSRTASVSRTPAEESVLLIAHGMGEDAENERLLAAMNAAAGRISGDGFARVRVSTLREDWPEARAEVVEEIRGFVSSEAEQGRTVLVIPYRLFGFGPYAAVLDSLEYVATDGFLPHPAISSWIQRTAIEIVCGNAWGTSWRRCGLTSR